MESTKSILIVLGHPNNESLCSSLADAYLQSAIENGHNAQLLKLSDLKFDPNLRFGYKEKDKLIIEEDILKSQKLISNSDHLVFIFPNWWSSMPAILKGWIDRVFLPGFAFQYQKKSPIPAKLLKGKTARIIITMDAPVWYYKWFTGSPGLKLLKKGTLEFCGITPVASTLLGEIRTTSKEKLIDYIKKINKLGSKGI